MQNDDCIVYIQFCDCANVRVDFSFERSLHIHLVTYAHIYWRTIGQPTSVPFLIVSRSHTAHLIKNPSLSPAHLRYPSFPVSAQPGHPSVTSECKLAADRSVSGFAHRSRTKLLVCQCQLRKAALSAPSGEWAADLAVTLSKFNILFINIHDCFLRVSSCSTDLCSCQGSRTGNSANCLELQVLTLIHYVPWIASVRQHENGANSVRCQQSSSWLHVQTGRHQAGGLESHITAQVIRSVVIIAHVRPHHQQQRAEIIRVRLGPVPKRQPLQDHAQLLEASTHLHVAPLLMSLITRTWYKLHASKIREVVINIAIKSFTLRPRECALQKARAASQTADNIIYFKR